MSDIARTVLVTGSASGIGAATRARLESQGVRVVGADLRDAEVEADLSTPEGRAELVARATELTDGVLDGVVTAAGLSHGPAVVPVNYFGTVESLRGLRPLLARSAAPRVVTVSSIGGLRDHDAELVAACLAGAERDAVRRAEQLSYALVYNSTKAAMERWLRGAAPTPEWAGAGITVNAVAPGVVETPLMTEALADPATRERLTRENHSPLHWPARVEEIAAPIAWLASPEASYVTGQVLYADGGYEVHLRGGAPSDHGVAHDVAPPVGRR